LDPLPASPDGRISSLPDFSGPTVRQKRRDTMIEVGSLTVLVFVKKQFQWRWSRFSATQQIA
jgi:hypothetical protein